MAAAAAAALTDADLGKAFREVTKSQSIDQQAMTFLKAFVLEFSGKFEDVLILAEEFKKFATSARGAHIQELDEFEAHRFFEQKDKAITVKDMRDQLKEIDIDSNNKVAFIEVLLFSYKKSVRQLFEARPNEALVRKLEAAIEQYKAVMQAKKDKEARIAELEELVKAGGKDASKAKVELAQLKTQDPASHAKDELGALHAKLEAKRALRNPADEEEKQFAQEQARVAEEKRAKEAEEALKRQQSKDKLKAKASLWN